MNDEAPQALFDPARHEPLGPSPWQEADARAAITRIVAAAIAEFEPDFDAWPMHPLDEPEDAEQRAYGLYHGSVGVVWALRELSRRGFVDAATFAFGRAPFDTGLLSRLVDHTERELLEADAMHGTASFFLGASAALLLAWQEGHDQAFADRLFDVVQGNLRNTALEALWGNPGTMLAAMHMHEAGEGARWAALLRDAADALVDSMHRHPQLGLWLWQQDLYGRRAYWLGAGHGLAGNVFALLRARKVLDGALVDTVLERTLDTLEALARHATIEGVACTNWMPRLPLEGDRVPRILVHDCHGSPGIVNRLGGAPLGPRWDVLLRGAGELTWAAGPLEKGPSLCHGTAGSAMACLKLWQRFGEAAWLDRARMLALHAAAQVERHRALHGMGRHSLWTGDLGVACVLAQCIDEDARFPSLEHFA